MVTATLFRRLILGSLLLALTPIAAHADVRAWVQMVDGGVVEVRAAADSGQCPAATVDGADLTMTVRAASDDAFPNMLCQLKLPTGAKHAEIGGASLPLPKPHIDRIVVMGDTGCRLKGLAVQACNDPRQWPFAVVAARAAAEHPDLVIHVGDYYYRESACPLNYAGCAGSPHGDAWPTWLAEFFDPAAPLLNAAPWVFARGNHESCTRGGKGWFRLLDAADAPLACPTVSTPFAVPIGGVTLHMLDSADTDDRQTPAPAVAAFKSAVETVKPWELPRWVIAHAAELGIELAPDGARALIAHVGERQQRLLRELEKLALGSDAQSTALDAEQVTRLTASSSERRAWTVADALVAGDGQAAVRAFLELRQQGERVPGLIYWISQRVRQAHEVAAALDAGEAPAQIRRRLRMPSRAADRLIDDAGRAGVERLRRATCEIADLELASRGGGSGGAGEDTAALIALGRIAA